MTRTQRFVSPRGDRREHPIRCDYCPQMTWALDRLCPDCWAHTLCPECDGMGHLPCPCPTEGDCTCPLWECPECDGAGEVNR